MGHGKGDSGGEERRLAALLRYGILDTPEEAAFDRLTELAARVFHSTLSTIGFVDGDHQWLKSRYGIDVATWPRLGSFCEHVVLAGKVTIVNDAAKNEHLRDHPMVKSGPQVRFCAGAPLVTPEGFSVGAIAVMDPWPRRDWSEEKSATLVDLASIAMHEMNLSLDLAQTKGRPRENGSGLHAMMES